MAEAKNHPRRPGVTRSHTGPRLSTEMVWRPGQDEGAQTQGLLKVFQEGI